MFLFHLCSHWELLKVFSGYGSLITFELVNFWKERTNPKRSEAKNYEVQGRPIWIAWSLDGSNWLWNCRILVLYLIRYHHGPENGILYPVVDSIKLLPIHHLQCPVAKTYSAVRNNAKNRCFCCLFCSLFSHVFFQNSVIQS